MPMAAPGGKKLLLLEFNEITWTLLDRMIEEGRMPNLARMRREGAWGSPVATERPPLLEPWISWVSVHSGFDASVHGARVLEQPAGTITARRSWHHVAEAGHDVGVFGSISTYPPPELPGFVVPGPFAPGPETHPPELQPVQELNRRYTLVHNRQGSEDGVLGLLRTGLRLLGLGLRPSTGWRIARQLLRERTDPGSGWRRVCLQPLVNYDFFAKLYRERRPHFATWHTNHVAHYQHHYWRAFDDSGFLQPAEAAERERYRDAIRHGHEIADEVLGRFLELAGDDTVVMLASSLGQKPYRNEKYAGGQITVRIRDIRRILELVGARGVGEITPVMAPQWNVEVEDPAERARVRAELKAVVRDGDDPVMFNVHETDDVLTVTPRGLGGPAGDMRVRFPGGPEFAFGELFEADDPTPKEGVHDPTGMVVIWGPGIVAGTELDECSNLDLLPTMLTIMGIDLPPELPGRVLEEAWTGQRPAGVRIA